MWRSVMRFVVGMGVRCAVGISHGVAGGVTIVGTVSGRSRRFQGNFHRIPGKNGLHPATEQYAREQEQARGERRERSESLGYW
jgi:hypothetical protein